MNMPYGGSPFICYILIFATAIISYRGFHDRGLTERWIFNPQLILGGKQYYRLISSGFLHLDWRHLLFNMITLYFFGRFIESAAGPIFFLLIYLGSIAGGGLISLLLHRNHDYRALGASGGVCGVLFAAIFAMPGLNIYMFFIPIPIPAWLYATAFVGYSCYSMLRPHDNVGHDAHLGGALVGQLLTAAWFPWVVTASPVLFTGTLCGIVAFLFYFSKRRVIGDFNLFSKQKVAEPLDIRYDQTSRDKRKKIDAILDKIAAEGMGSLNAEERRFLDDFSRRK